MVLEQDPVHQLQIQSYVWPGSCQTYIWRCVSTNNVQRCCVWRSKKTLATFPLLCSYLAGRVNCPTQFYLLLHAREPVSNEVPNLGLGPKWDHSPNLVQKSPYFACKSQIDVNLVQTPKNGPLRCDYMVFKAFCAFCKFCGIFMKITTKSPKRV